MTISGLFCFRESAFAPEEGAFLLDFGGMVGPQELIIKYLRFTRFLFEDSAREFEGMLIGKTHYVITLVGKRLGKLTRNGMEK